MSGENQDYRISGANRNTAVLAVQEVNQQYSRPCCIAKESTIQQALLCRKKTRSTAGLAVSEDNQQYRRPCCTETESTIQQALLYRERIRTTAYRERIGIQQSLLYSGRMNTHMTPCTDEVKSISILPCSGRGD